MNEAQFLWDHFKFNAEQRLKSFNFFVLLSIFADGGVFTCLEKQLHGSLLLLLGLFIFALSIVFWVLDTRSLRLIRLTIPALKEIERGFSKQARLFRQDTKQRGNIIRYTFAFRSLFISQLMFGLGVSIWGLYTWLG